MIKHQRQHLELRLLKLEVVVAPYCFAGLDIDFGKPLRKREFQKKYEAFYCSEIQSQGLHCTKDEVVH